MTTTDAPTIGEMAEAYRNMTAGSITAEQFRAVMRTSRETRSTAAHEVAKAQAMTTAYGRAA